MTRLASRKNAKLCFRMKRKAEVGMQIFLMSSEDGVFNSGVCWNSHVSKLNLWPGKLQDSEKIMTMSMSKNLTIYKLLSYYYSVPIMAD